MLTPPTIIRSINLQITLILFLRLISKIDNHTNIIIVAGIKNKIKNQPR